MEVQVGDNIALLTTHKTYRDAEEYGVKAVANYSPFSQYVANCAEHGPLPSTFIIRNIRRIAQRIVGVTMDVECETKSGKVIQTVDLCDSKVAILLPVVKVNEIRYVILTQQRRVSTGCRFTTEAICGTENSDKSFSWPNVESLVLLGFDLGKAHLLNTCAYTVGNEGAAPYKIYTMNLEITPEVLQSLQNVPRDGESSLLALTLDEVMSSVGDVKARLAVSLLLTLSAE